MNYNIRQLKTLCTFLSTILPTGSPIKLLDGDIVYLVETPKLFHNQIYFTFIQDQQKQALPISEFNLTDILNYWFDDDNENTEEDESQTQISAEDYFRFHAVAKPLGRAIEQIIAGHRSKYNQNKPHPAHELIRSVIRKQYNNPATETNTN